MKLAMMILASAAYVVVAVMFFLFNRKADAEMPVAYRCPAWMDILGAMLWPLQVAYLVYWIFRIFYRI